MKQEKQNRHAQSIDIESLDRLLVRVGKPLASLLCRHDPTERGRMKMNYAVKLCPHT
jgi:hypothetical protein